MGSKVLRSRVSRWENHLLGLSGLVALLCLFSVGDTPGPRTEIPEVIVPLVISLGLSAYTVSLQWGNCTSERLERMVKYGWAGALASTAIGGSWTVLHLYYGLPIDVLPDKILTLLSVGIAAGVFTGRSASSDLQNDRPADRVRVIAETSWANRSGPTPIFTAVVEVLAEVEEADPLELDSLYEHLDPEVLAGLRTKEGSQWQLLFFTNGYEIRVNSHGTVTVYSTEPLDDLSPTIASS